MSEAVSTHLGASGASEFVQLHSGDEEWKPGFDPEFGIQVMNVHGDPSQPGIYVIRIKWPPNTMSRPHHHPEDRHCTVLSGTWHAGTGPEFDPSTSTALGPGSYMFHPGGAVHWDGSKDEEAVIEIIGYGPTGMFPVDPDCCEFARI
ncbi:cupin domain-containing protein [Sinomonas humi]|uniref:cupin domain-containing protein n=1 Tax=Sinomonas humi TaxID=1338436 RepID=UPI00068D7BC1|nr:cupin domain-containing protein [Sinomonas humi]